MNIVTLCSIFKNESAIMKEWLTHYYNNGICDFLLCDDNSTDSSIEKINDFKNSHSDVSLDFIDISYNDKNKPAQRRFLDKLAQRCIAKEINTEWIIVIDLDEIVYNREGKTITNILKDAVDYNVILMPWLMYGPNGYINQPESVIKSFTKRIDYSIKGSGRIFARDNYNMFNICKKYAIRTKLVKELEIHNPKFINIFNIHKNPTKSEYLKFDVNMNGVFPYEIPNEITEYDISSNKYLLVINHYPYQSKDFWQTVKIARGKGATGHRQRTQPEWDEAEKKANRKLDTCLCDIKYTT